MRLLWCNLATDADDPLLGFGTRWIAAVARRVERLDVLTMRSGRDELPPNVRVFSVGKELGYSEPRRALVFYRHLARILTEGVDGCFSHMIPVFSAMAAPLLKMAGVPLVTWYAHPSRTRTLMLAHHLSTRMVASVASAYPYRHDKLIVLGQGIDTDLYHPDPAQHPDDPPILLCAGRLSPVKDHPTLLQAAALLRDQGHLPFQVVIVGGPATPRDHQYVAGLHEQVERLGLSKIVHFVPATPPEALPGWYRRCTVHVNLTPAGFGDKVAWESMACGRVCVAANPGFGETFGQHANALLFPHRDAARLTERLAAVLTLSASQRSAIGADLRAQVVRLHSLDRLAGRIVGLFDELRVPLATTSVGGRHA
jgi:glycosyltransferase involved in cell wall biosynthesis